MINRTSINVKPYQTKELKDLPSSPTVEDMPMPFVGKKIGNIKSIIVSS